MALTITAPELKSITLAVVAAGFARLSPADLLPKEDSTGRVVRGPLTFGINDPMDWADFPFIGINLLSDSEFVSHIGDSLADELVGLEGEVYAGASTLFQQHVEVKLWSRNGDERDRLGPLLKQALFLGRGTDVNPGLYLTTDGLSLPKITGGVDEGISITGEQYPAHTVYTRTYFVTAVTELTVQETAGDALSMVSVNGDYFQEDVFVELEAPSPF